MLRLAIDEKRAISALHRNKLFYLGVLVRLVFSTVPFIHEAWFVSFITNSFDSGIFNPWTAHTLSGGDSLAFPYGIVMYMAYAPLTFLGYNLDNIFSTTFFANVGFSFSSLLFDYLLLLAIALLSRGFSTRIILISYWCSPLVIYILYWHGQLDILPVFLLLLALIFLQRSFLLLLPLFLLLQFLQVQHVSGCSLRNCLYVQKYPLEIKAFAFHLHYFRSHYSHYVSIPIF